MFWSWLALYWAVPGFYVPGEERVNMVWGMVEHVWHKKGLGRELLEYRIRLVQSAHPECSIRSIPRSILLDFLNASAFR